MILQEARATLTLALPIVGTHLAQVAVHTTDVLMLARLSDHALGAGALAFSLFSFFWMLGIGLGIAVAALVAQAVGRDAKDHASVRAAVHDGLIVTGLGFAVSLAILAPARPLLVWFGQPPELVADTVLFLHLLMIGYLPSVWFSVLRAFSAALSRPRPALVFMILAVLLNAIAVYGLTFVAGLGIVGAGLGSALSNWLLFLGFAVYMTRDPGFARYRLWASNWWASDWHSSWWRLRGYLRIGGPIALTLASEVGLFSLAVQLMGRLGADAVAAHQIALQWATIAFMVPTGLSQAATVRVGLAAGARDAEGLVRAGWISVIMAICFGTCSGSLFWLLAPQLIGLFVPDAASPVFALAVSYLAMAALFQIVDGAQAVTNGVLRGLRDTAVPMLCAAVGYWLCGLPAALWFGFHSTLRGQGVWLGLVVGLAVAAVMLVWRFIWWTRRLRPDPQQERPA
ncbi:MATE family efflux transporter [Ferrovibrio xuzhouensis]|uniref:Multidrug-efflux transporter n=1 Tax=Ferrovibrio xuzhouensis TaxID=1576914 RepID=A0ABV7VFC5_9PROT